MKKIIKSQLYETVKSKSVWIAALVINDMSLTPMVRYASALEMDEDELDIIYKKYYKDMLYFAKSLTGNAIVIQK